MPIVFVHGVTVRDYNPDHVAIGKQIEQFLRAYVAPVIAPDPARVTITVAYWGDIGGHMAWQGSSCPSSVPFRAPRDSGPSTGVALESATDLRHIWQEGVTRLFGQVGNAGTRVACITRRSLNDLVTCFLGDIFVYLAHRGTADNPGLIPQRVLEALTHAQATQPAGEPLVVLSHSMGGQIVYDIVTHFLPNMPEYRNLRIDFWCAAASQVGLFEELKLFLASDPHYRSGHPVPFPDQQYLGRWWNVCDPNDVLSFTVHNIIADVDDSSYDSGLSAAEAHSGYLRNYTFFVALAQKLAAMRRC